MDSDEIAETRALARQMLRKKFRTETIEASYGRFATEENEAILPEWFVEDEAKHHVPNINVSKEQIAESILKPNASISQGFSSVMITANNGKVYSGFVTGESGGVVKMRNIIGQEFAIKEADIKGREELETSMMPTGLANSMSYEEFASLVEFLSKQK